MRCFAEYRCCGHPLQDQAAIDQLVAEVYAMALASHQFWGTWAVLQARFSPAVQVCIHQNSVLAHTLIVVMIVLHLDSKL